MATVYAGRLSSMAGFEKLVAIKVIHQHLSGETAFINMFLDEARIAAGIHHPNVGEIFEVGEDNGLYFMVGELVQGQSLQSLSNAAKSKKIIITQEMTAFIALKTCQGLHAAHELRGPDGTTLNLVHRDISPRNILVSYDGFVKLIDFGVAWAQGRLSHTDKGALKGKIGFMPPEQIRGEVLDPRSDLFSLGIIMYLLATGTHPFDGLSEAERLHKILYDQKIPPSKINPNLSSAFEDIVLSTMAADREKRYKNASVMADALEDFLRNSRGGGTTKLASLMRACFEQEKLEQEALLRKYRKDHENSASSLMPDGFTAQQRRSTPSPSDQAGHKKKSVKVPTPAKPNNLDVDEEITTASTWNSKATPDEDAKGKAKKKKKLPYLVGAAVGIIVVLIMWPALYPQGPEQGVPEPTPIEELVPPETETKSNEPSPAPEPTQEKAPTTIELKFDVHPRTAMIMLDGETLAPETRLLTLEANGQSHIIDISAENYHSVTKTVIADESRVLSVYLKPLPQESNQKQNKTKKRRTTKKKKQEDTSKTELKSSPYFEGFVSKV